MPSNKISRKDAGILALVAAFNLSIYLLASHLKFRIGFPLDDAWIHQTYARNFAAWGQWAFWEGQTSGGSTAPLWSAFLALGYWLKISFYVWAFVLGGVLLWGIALLGEQHLGASGRGYVIGSSRGCDFALGEDV